MGKRALLQGPSMHSWIQRCRRILLLGVPVCCRTLLVCSRSLLPSSGPTPLWTSAYGLTLYDLAGNTTHRFRLLTQSSNKNAILWPLGFALGLSLLSYFQYYSDGPHMCDSLPGIALMFHTLDNALPHTRPSLRTFSAWAALHCARLFPFFQNFSVAWIQRLH